MRSDARKGEDAPSEAGALTDAERAAVNAAACGNCGERTAVLNLAARIKAEAVQAERERWLAALATGLGAGMARAMIWDAADRLLAAEIARGEGR